VGVAGIVVGGSWTGREILLCLLMYRKYVRKWGLFKRNRIICPEVAVNEQFLFGKSIFFKLPEKIEKFVEKSKFFQTLAGKVIVFQKFAWKN